MSITPSRAVKTGCIATTSSADAKFKRLENSNKPKKMPNPISKLRWSSQCLSDCKLIWAPTDSTAITNQKNSKLKVPDSDK
jgi:hypothetical protein